MDGYTQALSSIIHSQELIIGPVALEIAKRVSGIQATDADHVHITEGSTPEQALENLVIEYSKLFGRASLMVCRDAIKHSTTPLDDSLLPNVLRS